MGEKVKKVCSRGRVLPFSMSCFLRWFCPKKYNSKNIEEWKNYLKYVLEVLKLSWKRGFRVLLSAMKCNSNDIFIGHRVLVMVMIHWFYRTLVLWQTRRFWLNSCGTQFLDLGFWVHFKIEKNQKIWKLIFLKFCKWLLSFSFLEISYPKRYLPLESQQPQLQSKRCTNTERGPPGLVSLSTDRCIAPVQ